MCDQIRAGKEIIKETNQYHAHCCRAGKRVEVSKQQSSGLENILEGQTCNVLKLHSKVRVQFGSAAVDSPHPVLPLTKTQTFTHLIILRARCDSVCARFIKWRRV